MRKLIMSTAALALVMPLSMGNIQPAGAAVVAGSEFCGELPNAKWSWSISYSDPVISGGETSTSTGPVEYNKPGTVGSAIVTTTTTPTISTVTPICSAYNPQNKYNADHSGFGEPISNTIDEGGETSKKEVVCNPSGNPVPVCPLP